MYKSIIFDLGGVMVDFDPKAYLVDRLCNAAIEEQVYDLTFGSEEWQQLDAGLVSRFNGNSSMLKKAKAAGREFEVQGVLDDWLHILRPRHRMEELVRRLKSHGYCVYYLSNIPQDVLDLLRDRGVLDGFDGGVASCEVHINKPDPKIYKALLDKCDTAYITKIHKSYPADCWLPDLDADPNWTLAEESEPLEEDGLIFHYATYKRI